MSRDSTKSVVWRTKTIRIPLVIRSPALAIAGFHTAPDTALRLDIAPILLEAAGLVALKSCVAAPSTTAVRSLFALF